MPTTAKPRKTTGSRAKSSSPRRRSTTSNVQSNSKPRSNSKHASNTKPEEHGSSIGDKVTLIAERTSESAGTVAKGAAAATAATAVAALAGRALIASRSRRKRVLGVPMPRRQSSVKGVAKRFAGMAGDLEKRSLDLSKASGRAKEAAKMLS